MKARLAYKRTSEKRDSFLGGLSGSVIGGLIGQWFGSSKGLICSLLGMTAGSVTGFIVGKSITDKDNDKKFEESLKIQHPETASHSINLEGTDTLWRDQAKRTSPPVFASRN